MTLGEKIRYLRKKKKVSQLELADACGYKSRGAISMIESGDRDISIDKVPLLAAKLGCTPGYLMGWEDEDGNEIIEDRLERLYSYLNVQDLTDEEITEIINYSKYLISKR